jgi:hypothetical protein
VEAFLPKTIASTLLPLLLPLGFLTIYAVKLFNIQKSMVRVEGVEAFFHFLYTKQKKYFFFKSLKT